MPNYSIQYIYELINKYSAPLKQITHDTRQFENQVASSQRALVKTNQKLKNYASYTFEANTKTNKFTGTIMNFIRKMRLLEFTIRTATLLAVYELIKTVKDSINAFREFERGVSNVLTLLSADDVTKFGSRVNKLTKNALLLGFEINDVNKSLFDNISALQSNEMSFKAFENAQKLAIAGNSSLGSSVKGISAIMNAYGRDITDSTKVANALFTAQKYGTTTVESLGNNIGKVLSIADISNISFEELLATISELTQQGLSTDKATTVLRATISALIDPSDRAARAFNRLKIPVGMVAIKQLGLGRTLMRINKAYEDNANVLSVLIPNVRALTGVASLEEDQLKRIDMIMSEINKDYQTGTGLNEKYADKMKTFDEKVKRLGGSFFLLKKSIGEFLAPILSPQIANLTVIFTALALSIEGVAKALNVVLGSLNAIKTVDIPQLANIGSQINKNMFSNLSGGVTSAIGGFIDINLNAPKGTVKSASTTSTNRNVKLGLNNAGA